MKYFLLLLFSVLSSRASSQWEHVDRNVISVEQLDGDVILGIEPITVNVTKVLFDKGKGQYILQGCIPALREDTSSELLIDLLRDKATVYNYSKTQKYGLFEVRMRRNDTLVFYDSIFRYAVYVKPTSKAKRK